MSSSKRALRRHHRDRLNRRTLNIFIIQQRWARPTVLDPRKDPDTWYHVNRRRDNMQTCSRSNCCGNPRRNKKSKLTMQELLQLDREKDQWEEVDNIIGL